MIDRFKDRCRASDISLDAYLDRFSAFGSRLGNCASRLRRRGDAASQVELARGDARILRDLIDGQYRALLKEEGAIGIIRSVTM